MSGTLGQLWSQPAVRRAAYAAARRYGPRLITAAGTGTMYGAATAASLYKSRSKRRRIQQYRIPRDLVRLGGYRGELKFTQSYRQITGVKNVWQSVMLGRDPDSLILIEEGTNEDERIGRTVYITSIEVKIYIEFDVLEAQTAPPDDIIVRTALVLDKHTNGVATLPTEIWEFAGADADIFQQYRNLQWTQDRIRVLKQKETHLVPMYVGTTAAYSWGRVKYQCTFHQKFAGRGLHMKYDGTGGGNAAIRNNALSAWITVHCGTQQTYVVRSSSRARFHE